MIWYNWYDFVYTRRQKKKNSEKNHMPWVGTDMLTEISSVSRILRKYCDSDVDICIRGYMHCICSPHSTEVVPAQTAELTTLTR